MRSIYWFLIGALFILLIAVSMGCTKRDHHAGEFRWDQGALHGSDVATCPSAVFVVRHGVLVECPP